MNCPNCDSSDVDQSPSLENDVIFNDNCIHTFKCFNCECIFDIEFHPIDARIVELNGSEANG